MKGLVIADGDHARAPVVNRSLLASAVETLAEAGAGRIAVVCDPQAGPALRSALEGQVAVGVEWIASPRTAQPGHAILDASGFLGGDRFAVHATNGLWFGPRTVLRRALEAPGDDAVLFLSPDAERRRRPRPAPVGAGESVSGSLSIMSDRELGGVHVFGPAMLDVLGRLNGSAASLVCAVDALIEAGGCVRAGMAEGWSAFGGDPAELLALNRRALDRLPEEPEQSLHGGDSRIEGRVRIHPTAHVSAAVIRGPAVIGAHARIADSYVGPYSVIGDAAFVTNSEIEASVVMTGARVHDSGVRIEGSLIGQGARIGRSFAMPKALRVVLGDDARVDLC